MATSRIVGEQYFIDAVTFGGDVVLPDGVVDAADVAAGAGIEASKLGHQHAITFAQGNTTIAAETRVIHVCGASGTMISFEAGSIGACTGNATITVDLKVNGSSKLSAVITLDSSNTARVAEAGTISAATLADGDVIEVVVAVNAGTGALGTGVFATLTFNQNYVA
jgi:hypothetical protein